MASKLPSRPLSNNNLDRNFSDSVKRYLKMKGMTQSDLAKKSLLTKTTISRICRNSNDKGSSYIPTQRTVISVSLGLGLTLDEAKELSYDAFPERMLYVCFLEKSMTVLQANEILYEKGLPLLGNTEE
ncbi:MAG: helix-turn-helix transcriptional regulator [Clostridiales bacterium]|nr:helix-turn-helix transcriptional regulator [Clostridiales bacterium]